MEGYEIPDLESWVAENESGTCQKPFLFNVTGGKYKKSLVFHMKIGDGYFEVIKNRPFKSDSTIWSTRCIGFQRFRTLGCPWVGRIQFRGDETKIIDT